MKKYVYSVKDKKLSFYNNPYLTNDDTEHMEESAIRGLKKGGFKDPLEVRDGALYFLGTFDDKSGKFELLDEPQKLIDYEDFIELEDGRKETN